MSNQLATLALHAGHEASNTQGTQAVPIYQTTSYVFNNSDHAAKRIDLSDIARQKNVMTDTCTWSILMQS